MWLSDVGYVTVLAPELIKLIDHKASEECGDTNLLFSSVYIGQLNGHINGTCELTKHEIESKIDNLAGCVTRL